MIVSGLAGWQTMGFGRPFWTDTTMLGGSRRIVQRKCVQVFDRSSIVVLHNRETTTDVVRDYVTRIIGAILGGIFFSWASRR
jgi:hypothetical protein